MSNAPNHAQHHGHFVVPKKVLASVFGGLIALTLLTVVTAKFLDLGPFNIVLALALASTKALLVTTYFMMLKYDNKVNVMVFSIGSLFVVIFITFTLFDTLFRGDVGNMEPLPISDQERLDEELQRLDPGTEDLRVAPGDYEAAEEVATDGAVEEAVTE